MSKELFSLVKVCLVQSQTSVRDHEENVVGRCAYISVHCNTFTQVLSEVGRSKN